jgi:hypothetical protein
MKTFLRFSSLALAICAAAAACNPHVITGSGGDGGSGTGGSGTGGACGFLTFTCAPGTCSNGAQANSHAVCEGGTWACVADPCGSCNGYAYPYCANGFVETQCCPAGAPCSVPPAYCDLGNGTCSDGPCPPDGGTCGPSISASSYDQSCTTDADCIAVYEGPLCDDCLCVNAAINQGANDAYEQAINAAEPDPPACFCPSSPPPRCYGGTCTLIGGI